jgi:hypothetical protein
MDDIFLFAPDKHTLTENTKRVLARLQENDLFLKPTKCKFNKTKIEYLGMVIEEGKISMDPGKLRVGNNMGKPMGSPKLTHTLTQPVTQPIHPRVRFHGRRWVMMGYGYPCGL